MTTKISAPRCTKKYVPEIESIYQMVGTAPFIEAYLKLNDPGRDKTALDRLRQVKLVEKVGLLGARSFTAIWKLTPDALLSIGNPEEDTKERENESMRFILQTMERLRVETNERKKRARMLEEVKV